MKIYVALCAFAIIAHISPSNGDQQCEDNIDWAKKSAEPLADFTVQLYRAISNGDQEKNIIFSPVSVSLALALLEAGAENQTRSQMRYVLVKRGSSDSDTSKIYQSIQKQLLLQNEEKVKLNVVNGFYHQDQINLKEGYLNFVRQCFETVVDKCNFRGDAGGCRNQINSWVANATSQKIPELFQGDSINQDTVAVLANAVYFKAAWEDTFPSMLISDSPFYRFGRENDEQTVKYLNNDDQYLYSQTNTVSIVGIPYKGGDFHMFIILPKKRDGLEEVERTFTGTELLFLINRTKMNEVQVKIPKFKVKTRVDLKPILVSLGLKDMFDSHANFSRMTNSRLLVDAAVHEAFINVNENGTEAAGATGLAIRPMSARPIAIPFVANHPFLYAIVHYPTRAIIFAGKILYVEQD